MNKPRLIDANKLKKKIKDVCGGQTEILIQLVDNIPTAYDVTSVVEQLQEESKSYMESAEDNRIIGNELVYRVFRAKSEALAQEAIEIVRNGGGSDV